jgi:TolA-binding protein
LLLAVPLLGGTAARAQMDSREGIALQNQILQLRAELEQLRRGGSALGAAPAAPRGAAPQGELVGQLLERVGNLEEETRRLRGRVDQLENQNRQLTANVEKLQGDIDYRLQQLEGTGGGRPPGGRQGSLTPPPGGAPPGGAPGAGSGGSPAGATPPPIAAPRTPERALAEGHAALARRDYTAAEAAAREALAARSGANPTDARLLLGDALMGRRDFGAAAVAYDDALKRARTGPRAPEAMLGLANAFAGLNSRREACETLDELRSSFPTLRQPVAQQAAEARRRAGCR